MTKAIRIFETGGPEVMQYVDVDVPARDAAAGGAGHEQMRAAGALACKRCSPCVARHEGGGGDG